MIYVVVGPTGVGKTKLSVELAKRMNAEVVNADSMQVYKGLDIATAKVKESEKEGIVHYLFDICNVEDDYSVFDYQKDVRKVIEDIQIRGKNVILVGGTGLYIRAALFDYQFQTEDKKFDYSQYSNEELYQEILKYNPKVDIHPNNRRRLERYLTRIKSGDFSIKKAQPIYDFIMVGLTTKREELYMRINRRVLDMIDEGMVEEAKKYYDLNLCSKALKTGIGYKELFLYFDGFISLDVSIALIQKNTRHYAKRQYTFFRNQFQVHWFETNYLDFSKTVEEVFRFLNSKHS